MELLGLIIFSFFSLCSFYYVYRVRGCARFASFSEYFRKGWPVFTPFNSVLYIFTKPKARKAIMNVDDFPELKIITENWQTIRSEAIQLRNSGGGSNIFDQTSDPNNKSHYDIGFRTFYKYGWRKFYLKWYGYTHLSALSRCPKTLEILKKIKTVNGAMFSILPVGGQLTRHLDPMACSLRYHLALDTPNSQDCFINVDENDYYWKNGEAFIFDETYIHYAKNNSQKERLILMCDIERPLFFIGRCFNYFYKILLKATLVPNTEEDSRGVVNIIFSTISPILKKAKVLKEKNRTLYLLLKYAINTTLLVLLVFLILGVIKLSSLVLT